MGERYGGSAMRATLEQLLGEARRTGTEADWFEFKHNNADPAMVGERLSALANSASLASRDAAYMVWGVEDESFLVVGTTFRPGTAKVGNEGLEPWLAASLQPRVAFRFHEIEVDCKRVVLLEIPRARQGPIAFRGVRYVRIASSTHKLLDYPDLESALWQTARDTPFEADVACKGLAGADVLEFLDFPRLFTLLLEPMPETRDAVLGRLEEERLIARSREGGWGITNLGAILLAKDLGQLSLPRKALRIVRYTGAGRLAIERQWDGEHQAAGYAVCFRAAVDYVGTLLPQNEPLRQALRVTTTVYPPVAVRELVANALIHQDLRVHGAGPLVEIFDGRLEVTSPGEPLVDPRRFINAPPLTRNERLGGLMRRMRMCEELGTGIDRVIESVEAYQLPAPRFESLMGSTKVTLFAHRPLRDMSGEDRVRACFQHACLQYALGRAMTNASLRTRFGIADDSPEKASRIIRQAVDAGVIRPRDPSAGRRDMAYVPILD